MQLGHQTSHLILEDFELAGSGLFHLGIEFRYADGVVERDILALPDVDFDVGRSVAPSFLTNSGDDRAWFGARKRRSVLGIYSLSSSSGPKDSGHRTIGTSHSWCRCFIASLLVGIRDGYLFVLVLVEYFNAVIVVFRQNYTVLALEQRQQIAAMLQIEISDGHVSDSLGKLD